MKKIFLYIILGGIASMLFVASCKKDTPVTPLNEGYNYFPNNVGHYVIYNVDSVTVNQLDTQVVQKYKYQIKEVIDSIYTDAGGRPTQRIVRYKRADSSKPWVIQKVWSGNLTKTTGERIEDNEKYVRLIFPLSANAQWNGNGFNTLGAMNYQYMAIDVPFTLGGTHFDSTLTVLQDSNVNLVQHQYYFERYARNVGRIYRDVIDLSPNGNGLLPPLGQVNLIVTDSLLKQCAGGSVVYTENYVSSGN